MKSVGGKIAALFLACACFGLAWLMSVSTIVVNGFQIKWVLFAGFVLAGIIAVVKVFKPGRDNAKSD